MPCVSRYCNSCGQLSNVWKVLIVSLTIITTMVAGYFVLPDHLVFILMIFSPFVIGGIIFGGVLFAGAFGVTKACERFKRKRKRRPSSK